MNLYQLKDKKQNIIIFLSIVILYFLFENSANAKQIYLPIGGSHIIKVQEEIDTVFVSAAKTADYEIVDNNSVIIYAKKEGLAEFTLFNKNHQPISKTRVLVNNTINDAYRRIRTEFPDSKIEINKIGESYILTGSAETRKQKIPLPALSARRLQVKKKKREKRVIKATLSIRGLLIKLNYLKPIKLM